MKIEEYDLPDDLYYHKEHCYAKKEGDLISIGISDFAQQMAGTIKRVETLEEDDEVSQDKPFGTMSSGKWRPIQVPKTTSPPRLIQVRKVSH